MSALQLYVPFLESLGLSFGIFWMQLDSFGISFEVLKLSKIFCGIYLSIPYLMVRLRHEKGGKSLLCKGLQFNPSAPPYRLPKPTNSFGFQSWKKSFNKNMPNFLWFAYAFRQTIDQFLSLIIWKPWFLWNGRFHFFVLLEILCIN